MPTKIINGFPLRRCSWSYSPIVSGTLSNRMLRWLDAVCLKRAALKA